MARPKRPVAGPGRPPGRQNNQTIARQVTIRELIHKHYPGGREGLVKQACKLAAAGDAALVKLLLAYDSGAPPQEVKLSGTKDQPIVVRIIREEGRGGNGNGNGGEP